MAHVTSSKNSCGEGEKKGMHCLINSGSQIFTNYYANIGKSAQYLLRLLYIHVTGSSKITSVHESTIRACGILWGAQIVSDGHSESSKPKQYLLRSLYIHVTDTSWISGENNNQYGTRPKMAMGIKNNMFLVFYPPLYKSDRYLLRPLYIHVTGSFGNNDVWNIKERNRVEMSILWGNGSITGAGQACYKSNRYLLRPTLVRFS